MEAKDTVIKLKSVPNPIFEGEPNTYDTAAAYTWGWKEGTERQAEISFKAGQDSRLKEVKEWIAREGITRIKSMQSDDGFADVYQIYLEDWQTFLNSLKEIKP